MKIARIETFIVPPRWCFLRIETDDGVVGWGEPVIEGRAHTVAAAVDELTDYLLGADPLRIEDHWQVLTKGGFYRGGPILSSAVAGIDQALWDIAGKVRNAPVHELLGGPLRDRQRVYTWIAGDEPAAAADEAAVRKAQGLTAVKMNGSGRLGQLATVAELDEVVARVAAVQEVMGNDGGVAVDLHGRATPAIARTLCRLLEPHRPMFIEEPLVPELSMDLARICASTTIPIATGERLFSRWDFRQVLGSGIAIAQPDLSHAGGISECRRIASMAEAFGVSMAPHCPLGPIALAACLQLDFATPNTFIQEMSWGIHYNQGTDLLDYLLNPDVFAVKDGHIARPTGPGLGIEINETGVREAAREGHRWRSPIWRLPDGALAEW
jgi:galactonate dehydratase